MNNPTILDIILDQRFVSIVSVIITAILSYIFTKKTEIKKHDVDTYMTQLKKIYLPLYLTIYNKDIDEIDFDSLYRNLILRKKKYFLYCSGHFLRLVEAVEHSISLGDVSYHIQVECVKHIENEYFRLRRLLGYPYSFQDQFKNLTLLCAIKWIIKWCSITMLIGLVIIVLDPLGIIQYKKIELVLTWCLLIEIISIVILVFYSMLLSVIKTIYKTKKNNTKK